MIAVIGPTEVLLLFVSLISAVIGLALAGMLVVAGLRAVRALERMAVALESLSHGKS
jgi:hypothetical protein